MKLVGAISTAVLSLSLGIGIPAYAQQEQHDQQEEQKAKPVQNEKKAQPEKPAKAEEKNVQQEEKSTRPGEKNAQQEKDTKEEKNAQEQHTQRAQSEQQGQRANNNGGGRIPADRYKANFGQEHRFRVSQAATAIAASNTVATGSDLRACGQATGCTRRTFLLSK